MAFLRKENVDNDFQNLSDDDLDVDENIDDDDDWTEPDAPVLCLFCNETLTSTSSLVSHLTVTHSFRLERFVAKRRLDAISFIKFVNFVRKTRISAEELEGMKEETQPWSSDDFMFPVIADDPLLMMDVEQEDNEEGETMEDSSPRTAAKLQALEEDLRRIKALTAEMILGGGDEDGAVPRRDADRDGDQSYFSSYTHFSIHREMLGDAARTSAYRDALQRLDLRGKTVLDVGCGTGVLSLFAARAGAERVIAVDMSEIVYQAMDIAMENGLHDRITFLKGKVEDLELSVEKVDVIVSEWMGYFLLYESMLDSVLYARDKWLKPGGIMLPDKCTLSLGPLTDESYYASHISFWDDVYGFKMSCMKSLVVAEAAVTVVDASSVGGPFQIVKEIDICTTKREDLDFSSSFSLGVDDNVAESPRSIFGLVGFFDVTFPTSPLVVLSTSPSEPPTHWKQTVYLFPKPISVESGESLKGVVDVRKDPADPRSLLVGISLEKTNSKRLLYHVR